ncbi:DUF3971 domain-containing protein [Epibacterium sp. SM1979]|uniref:DUF3971 domain-containing protein n=1 Tax=Tritonibacter litoralis TaxID=2662264 RepID=A0A843YAS0_9RHOB|nr:AsmA-like C-terminal region-containing protein [Tritonibacter litoralis]MQQ06978.1 DUF3971 domain-containing protein [Tritonibacter litoralis]
MRWVSLFCILAALVIYFGQGRQFDLPPWMRDRVEQVIEAQMGALDVEFGGIEVIVNQGWRPRVGLRDVVLRYEDGSIAAQLSDAQASFSMNGLLQGKVQPKSVYVAGVVATLQRSGDSVALSLADGASAVRQAQNLPQLIEQWDLYLDQPGLSALRSIDVEAVTLQYEDLRIGRAWTFDGGFVRLDRTGQEVALSAGFSVLGGGANVGQVDARYRSLIGDTAADFGIAFTDLPSEDIAVQSPALGWLEILRAPISGNLRGRLDSHGVLEPVSASLEIGEGALQPDEAARPVPFDGASSYFTYFPAEQLLQFDGLSISTGWGSGQMEGVASLSGIENGQLKNLVGQLRFSDLQLNPFYLYPDLQSFAGVTTDFKLDLDPFRLTLGEATVTQDATTVHLSGEVWTNADGWAFALDGNADVVTVDQVKTLWPSNTPPKPREWVQKNLHEGVAHDIQVALRSRVGQKPLVSLSLGFQDVRVSYQKFMPDLTGAMGQFSLHDKRLVASATAGQVTADLGGSIDVAGTSFIIPDTSVKGGGPAVVRLAAKGAVTAALSLLNRAPLSVMDKVDLPVDLADGQAQARGTLSLALKEELPIEEIEYHYSGVIRAAKTDKLVPGHVLTADQLNITGAHDFVQITGAGEISGIAATVDWQLPLGQEDATHQANGTIALTPETVEVFNIGLPRGTVSGAGTGSYQLTLSPGLPPDLQLKSDLQGLGLRIRSLGWRKSPAAQGTLEVAATLGAVPRVDQITVSAAGLSAQGRITLRENGGLDQAAFNSVRIGNWLNSSATFTGRGAAAPALALSGGRLDLRTAPFSTDSGSGGGGSSSGDVGPIQFALDRLQVNDSIALHNVRGRVSTQGGLNGEFRGQINGQTAVSGVLVPQNGGLGMRVQSDDAGGVFRSAGVLRHAAEGSFDMTLVPSTRPGYFNGRITANNIYIRQAPAMLALVNAVSLVGLLTELTGQGLLFTEIDARFELGPTHLKLVKSSAVGPSIGLSMDGIYDLENSVLDMRGVLSPIYLVNVVGSVLTRKGEGLIGFNFNLRGAADDPKVSVNPLSGLAPGFLREVFRRQTPLAPGEERPARKSFQERKDEREER